MNSQQNKLQLYSFQDKSNFEFINEWNAKPSSDFLTIKYYQEYIIYCYNSKLELYKQQHNKNDMLFLGSAAINDSQMCFQAEFIILNKSQGFDIIRYDKKSIYIISLENNQIANQKQLFSYNTNSEIEQTNQISEVNLDLIYYRSSSDDIIQFTQSGLIKQYDMQRRRITNQIQWYIPQEEYKLHQVLQFNAVSINSDTLLYVQLENASLKLGYMSLNTFEVTYEQVLENITIDLARLQTILKPIYFAASDTVVIIIVKKKQTTDYQNNQDYYTFKRQAVGQKYTFQAKFTQPTFFQTISVSMEYIAVFELQNVSATYKMYIYDLFGVKKYSSSSTYKLTDPDSFCSILESSKTLIQFQRNSIVKLDLVKLTTSTVKTYVLPNVKYSMSPDSTLIVIQLGIGTLNIYSYPGLSLQATTSFLKQKSLITWNGNNFLLTSFSTEIIYYQYPYFVPSTSTTGNNLGAFWMSSKQFVFITEKANIYFQDLSQSYISLQQFQSDSVIKAISPTNKNEVIVFPNKYSISMSQNYFSVFSTQFTNEDFLAYFSSTISEKNILVSLLRNNMTTFYDLNNNQVLNQFSYNYYSTATRILIGSQNILEKIFYYNKITNTIVIIYNYDIIIVDGQSLEKKTSASYIEEIMGATIDENLNMIYYTINSTDCFVDLKFLFHTFTHKLLIQARKIDCIKEKESYSNSVLQNNRVFKSYIDPTKTKVTFIQNGSIRVYSLQDKKYVKSLYDQTFIPEYVFFNKYQNYILFSQQSISTMKMMDLSTLQQKVLNLYSADVGTTKVYTYNIFFLSDGTYVFMNTNQNQIYLINQTTHEELYQIPIPQSIYTRQAPMLNEEQGLLFYIDIQLYINIVDFKDKKRVISTLAVRIFYFNDIQYLLIFKQIKINLFVNIAQSFTILYDDQKYMAFVYSDLIISVYNLRTFLQEYSYSPNGVFSFNLNYQKSVIYFTGDSSLYKLNYNFILKGYSKKLSNINNPKILQVDQNKYLFSDQINNKITLFDNSIQTSQLTLLEKNSQMIRTYTANNKKTEIFIINYNTIHKINIDINLVMKVVQSLKLESTIIQEILDSDDGIYFLCQNKKLIMIPKNTQQIQIKDLFLIQNGIGKFIVINKKLIFSSFAVPLVLNILDLETLIIKSIQITEQPLKLKQLSSSQVLILFSQSLVVLNINTSIIEKQEIFKLSSDASVVVDTLYNRIYLIDTLYNTKILNYDLKLSSPISEIISFDSKLKLDINFIYIISTHSALIYSRKDLQYLQIFRNFDILLSLKDISYIGISYIFLVEFDTKFSLYEINPFQNQNQEKFSFSIENYIITNKQITKAIQNDDDYLYQIQIAGFSNEGYFSYSVALNIYDSTISQYCSFYLDLPSNDVLFKSSSLKLNNQLQSLNKKLTMLNIYVYELQKIKFPDLLQTNLNPKFDLSYINSNSQKNMQELYGNTDLKSSYNIQTLSLKDILFYSISQDTNQILISQQTILQLQKLIITNITIREIAFIIKDISTVIIEKLTIETNENEYETTIQIFNAKQVIINQLIIQNQQFNLKNSFIQFNNCQQITIDDILIQNTKLRNDSNEMINIIEIQNSEIVKLSNIFLKSVNISEARLLIIKNITTNLEIFNTQLNIINQNITNSQLTTVELFKFENIQQLQVSQLIAQYLNITSKIPLNILSIMQIQKSLLLDNIKLYDIDILSKTEDSYLCQVQASTQSTLQNIQIQDIKYFGFFNFDIIESEYTYSKNRIVMLQNVLVQNSFQDQYFIKINAVYAKLQNIIMSSITSYQKSDSVDKILIELETEFKIENLKIANIVQTYGNLISINNCAKVNINSLMLSNIVTQQNGSCLNIQNCKNTILSYVQVQLSKSNSDGSAINFVGSHKIQINKSTFSQNESVNGSGGAIACENSDILTIEDTIFADNQAQYGSGGAIYLNKCELKNLSQNQFISNKALVGGSIRYMQKKPFVFLNGLENAKKLNKFYKNICKSFGQDIGSYPYILDIKQSYDDDDQNTLVTIDNLQSGYKALEPIMLRFIDEEMREVTFFDLANPEFSKVSQSIIQEFNSYNLNAESSNIGLLGEVNQYYNYEKYGFVFDLAYSFNPGGSAELVIKSTQPQPQFLPNQQEISYLKYEKKINLKFRKCVTGEIIQSQGVFTICYTCDEGYYNLRDPYEEDNDSCKKCPFGAQNCTGNKIELRNGFWRQNEASEDLIECVRAQTYCKPEEISSINGCSLGHIGPRCEECDTRGNYWNRTFGKNTDFSCMDCSLFKDQDNLMMIQFIFGLVLAYTVFQIYKQISTGQRLILAYYLKKMRILDVKNYNMQVTSYMKILTSYFQFMTIITSLDVKVPIYLNNLNIFGGDTSSQTLSRIDCLIFQVEPSYPDYIVRLLWINFQPIFILVGAIFTISGVLRVRKIQQNSSQIISSCIFIYMFFQPSVIKVISQTFTCESIASSIYIISDLTQICYDENHRYYLFRFVLPMIIFWLVLVPSLLFFRLRAHRNAFDKISVIYKYGYLYQILELIFLKIIKQQIQLIIIQEYRHESFYWDLIRLILRSFLIVLVNLLRFNVSLQGLVFAGILTFYAQFQKLSRPYVSKKLNILDRQSCFVSLLTIYIIFFAYFFDNDIINFISGILIVLINVEFIFKMALNIVIKPVNYNVKERNSFERLQITLKNRYPIFFSWVVIAPNHRLCKQNWIKVKQVVQTIKVTHKNQQMQQKQVYTQNIKKLNLEKSMSLLRSKIDKRQTIMTNDDSAQIILTDQQYSTFRAHRTQQNLLN